MPITSERQLSQQVLQTVAELGFVHAELARILGLQCQDIGQLSCGKRYLQKDSHSWHQAKLFLTFHQQLGQSMQYNEIKMHQWIRRRDKRLGDSPHALIIDHNRLEDVIHFLKQHYPE